MTKTFLRKKEIKKTSSLGHRSGAPLKASHFSPSCLTHNGGLSELSYTSAFQNSPSCLSPVFLISIFSCFVCAENSEAVVEGDNVIPELPLL